MVDEAFDGLGFGVQLSHAVPQHLEAVDRPSEGMPLGLCTQRV